MIRHHAVVNHTEITCSSKNTSSIEVVTEAPNRLRSTIIQKCLQFQGSNDVDVENDDDGYDDDGDNDVADCDHDNDHDLSLPEYNAWVMPGCNQIRHARLMRYLLSHNHVTGTKDSDSRNQCVAEAWPSIFQ